ncbi:hypothetical protein ACLB2K_009619 [Fragaria x ananassa]
MTHKVSSFLLKNLLSSIKAKPSSLSHHHVHFQQDNITVMARVQNLSLVSHLKRAVKKVRLILLGLKLQRWRVASILGCAATKRRSLSFNDRFGLKGCMEEVDASDDQNGSHLRRVHSSISRSSSTDYEDVDQRADAFIANFRRQLRLERQVSLELRQRVQNQCTDYIMYITIQHISTK